MYKHSVASMSFVCQYVFLYKCHKLEQKNKLAWTLVNYETEKTQQMLHQTWNKEQTSHIISYKMKTNKSE